MLSIFAFSQVTSSNARAACTLCCRHSRSSGQFASKNSLYLSNLLLSLPSESCYSVNVNQSRNGYDILLLCYSVNVNQSRNGYDILLLCYSVNVNQSRNGYDILLFAILLMSTNPTMDTTYSVKFNSQFVLHS